MLCYDISNCDWCGKICINRDDNLLERKNIIKRSHLTRKQYIKLENVVVLKTCNGEQSYCPKQK